MKRKSKKVDTPIEMVIALAIEICNYTKTKNLNKSIIIFFISVFIFGGITITIKYFRNKKHNELSLASGIDIADSLYTKH